MFKTNPEPLRTEAMYLSAAFVDDFGPYAEHATKQLKDVDYDTMIGTGLSGALVVPRLARALGKYWAIVRKEDGSHSTNKVEGKIGQSWIFVDDVVDSGDTQARVIHAVRHHIEVQNYRTNNDNSWRLKEGRHLLPTFSTEYLGTYTYGEFGPNSGRFSTHTTR